MADKKKGGGITGFLERHGVLMDDATGSDSSSAAASAASSTIAALNSLQQAPAGTVNQETLQQLLDAAIGQSTDYGKFMTAANALAAQIPDEYSRLKTAFLVEKAHGASLDALLKGIQTGLDVLEQKKVTFNGEFEEHFRKEVATRQDESEETRKAIDERKNQIAALQSQVADLEAKDQAQQAEIQKAQGQLGRGRAVFEATLTQATKTLNDARTKLATILKGV
jgi:chromosome segregation ATPase